MKIRLLFLLLLWGCGESFFNEYKSLPTGGWCSSCNSKRYSTSFCFECGNKIVQVLDDKICPKCSSGYPKTFIYCTDCGIGLVELKNPKNKTLKLRH